MLRWVGTAFLFFSQLKYLDAADCPCVSGSWKYNGKLNFKFLLIGAFISCIFVDESNMVCILTFHKEFQLNCNLTLFSLSG